MRCHDERLRKTEPQRQRMAERTVRKARLMISEKESREMSVPMRVEIQIRTGFRRCWMSRASRYTMEGERVAAEGEL